MMEISVGRLAELLGGRAEGPAGAVVRGVGGVDDADEGALVLAENERYLRKAVSSNATCILAGLDAPQPPEGKSLIRVADPGDAFVRVLDLFRDEDEKPAAGVGPGAIVSEGASVGEGVAIGANCYVAGGASLGDGCVLYPNCYIGDGVSIGENSTLYPGVTIYSRCSIGKRVTLHAGVVIGADGFGYRPGPTGLMKLPHIGTVEIGDDVEIGANSAVDRAKFGATLIGSGSKIDNLVHIAHNVRIGRNCVIVALSGVAGSVRIGDGVTLAAQTGVSDHVVIEDGCVVAARAGVIGDLPKGSVVSGFPARDHATEKRAQAAFLRLPDLVERIRELEREVARMRDRDEG